MLKRRESKYIEGNVFTRSRSEVAVKCGSLCAFFGGYKMNVPGCYVDRCIWKKIYCFFFFGNEGLSKICSDFYLS